MTEWLISGNPKKYDVLNAFRELKKVDWKQSTNVKEGDIVYIYVSADVKSIKLKCRANKVDITIPDIDDKKFNISGEYDGTAGRYMELEMLEEFETGLFSKAVLEKHGFSSPQSPVRVTPEIKEYLDIVQYIFETSELNPSDHDGSYELVNAVIEAYASMKDLSVVDYRDLNLVYLMSVGTWKHGVSAKKNTIEESNLPKEEKQGLLELLDNLWKKAELGGFSNQERATASLGMFGTGFYTFKDKTDVVSPRKFIELCIDIQKDDDEEKMFQRCTETFTPQFKGMRAASASMVLHCLNPFVFPVFNSNMGNKNIFEYFGVEMKYKNELVHYINNVRKAKEYRDYNFKTKNYRVFDMAAWKIGDYKNHTEIDYLGVLDYLENNREVPYSNPEKPDLDAKEKERLLELKAKAQTAIGEMKKMAGICKEKFELDKCETIAWLDATNVKTRKYLWAQLKYNQYGKRPESISIFVEMSEVTNKARYRFSLELKNDGSDKAAVANYHRHLELPFQPESTLVYVAGSNEYGNPKVIEDDRSSVKEKIASGEYKKVQISRVVEWNDELTSDEIEEAMVESITELIPFYEYVIGKTEVNHDDGFWPSLEEYNPNLTKDDWVNFINEVEKPDHPSPMKMLVGMLELGGQASCKELSEVYGGKPNAYIGCTSSLGRRAKKYFDKPGCMDDGQERVFVLPFQGKRMSGDYGENYVYRMRPELKAALSEIDLSEFSPFYDENEGEIEVMKTLDFSKNTILYGPPGTGKTYATAVYAVAIIENKSVDDVKEESYDDVFERYNQYKEAGQVAFTTFHQSYGYEEFIEGIKPVVGEGEGGIGYTIEDGVFKAFCEDAKMPENKIVDHNAKIWKVVLQSGNLVSVNTVKFECFNEGKIMYDWKTKEEHAGTYAFSQIAHFQEKVNVGDIVVTYAGSGTDIDAIGIVTGDAEYDDKKPSFRWSRAVEWLETNKIRNIKELNGNKYLDNDQLQHLKRVSSAELLKLVKPLAFKPNDKNYVFIIDEINRGNISKIFGELITLIEDTKRAGMDEEASAILPYSAQPFSVPSNVYILGTMNTADRSIALMDTALRRRFEFIEMMPDADVLRKIGADKVEDLDVAMMLEAINERITFLYDREHTIGHAFFTKLAKKPTVATLKSIFEKSVIPLLQEYFYEDYQKIQLVLGDNGKSDDTHKFILDSDVKVKDIFKGSVDDVIDLPEKKYTINLVAFDNIDSYKEII